jgi:hypothetical protein
MARTKSRSRKSRKSKSRKSKSKRSKSKRSQSRSRSCKKGQIHRVGYSRTSVNGKRYHVKGNCIRSTSQKGTKRSLEDKKYFQQRAKLQARAARLTRSVSLSRSSKNGSRSCPRGEIKRVAYQKASYNRRSYTRKNGTRVKAASVGKTVVGASCAPKRGKFRGLSRSGEALKGTPLFHLEKEVLKPFGYFDLEHKTRDERQRALSRAVNKLNPLSVYRRVNALYVVNKNQNPSLAKKLQEDKKYIQTTNSYKNRPTAPSRSKTGGARKKSKSKSKNKSRSSSKRRSKRRSK